MNGSVGKDGYTEERGILHPVSPAQQFSDMALGSFLWALKDSIYHQSGSASLPYPLETIQIFIQRDTLEVTSA